MRTSERETSRANAKMETKPVFHCHLPRLPTMDHRRITFRWVALFTEPTEAFGDKPVDCREPALADRVPLEEGLVLRFRELDEDTVRQQPGRAAMRLRAQKGLDP